MTTRAVESVSTVNAFDIARQKHLGRSVSTSSPGLDLSAILPGDGYSTHPSFICATSSEASSSPSLSSSPALKKLFTVRSLIRLLPLHSFDLVPEHISLSPFADIESTLPRKRKLDDICRGDFIGDHKRSCGSSTISLKIDPTEALALTNQAFSQFIDNASTKFAELSPFESPSLCLVESFQTFQSEGVEYFCEAIDLELDKLCCESAVEPDSFAAELKGAVSHCEAVGDDVPTTSKTLEVIRSKIAIQALADILSCLENLHTSLFAEAHPNRIRLGLYRMFMTVLYAMVCRSTVLAGIFDGQCNRRYRNNVISVFFKATLRPILSTECSDVLVLSKAGLAHLDAKQKKIPRDVVESVLRPALIQFLDLNQVDMRLIVGLHSIVELFPSLFKEVFARRILDTLKLFVNPDEALSARRPREEVIEMLVYLLDFFRLFASSKTFSCAHWIDTLAQLVLDLEASWLSVGPMVGQNCCCGFRSALCRLLCHYPVESAALLLEKGQQHPIGILMSSLYSCHHAHPLRLHLQQKLSNMSSSMFSVPAISRSSQFSDLLLVHSASGQSISAHRVVLASRSEYFRCMLGSRMSECEQSVISLNDVKFEALDILIDFIYSQSVESLSRRSQVELMELLVLGDRFLLKDVVCSCEQLLASKVSGTTILSLLDFAKTLLSANVEIDPKLCGPCGMTILRSCQSFLLSNLGTMCDEIDVEDPAIVSLLASDHKSLCRSRRNGAAVGFFA